MSFGQELSLFGLIVPIAGMLWILVFKKRYSVTNKLPKAKRVRATFAGVAEVESRLAQPSKWLFLVGLAFVIVALARPRWGEVYTEVFQRSREVIIAMDLSKLTVLGPLRHLTPPAWLVNIVVGVMIPSI